MKTSGIEVPEINPHSYRHLIFDKRIKNIHWRKHSLSTNGAVKTGYLHTED
jgi:hypothetical protein